MLKIVGTPKKVGMLESLRTATQEACAQLQHFYAVMCYLYHYTRLIQDIFWISTKVSAQKNVLQMEQTPKLAFVNLVYVISYVD